MHGSLASPLTRSANAGFGWLGIVRIGLVQASIGALVMLATTVLNRVMVVELGLAAAIPAGLVAWHYAVQLGRPLWGHASDHGNSRTRWIIGGVAVLAAGGLLAVQATLMLGDSFGREMENAFQEDLRDSEEITRAKWETRPISDRMKEWAARFMNYWL